MARCERFPGVTAKFPFGAQPKCYCVGGRIFAEAFPNGVVGALRLLYQDETVPRERVEPMMTLRCDPATGEFFKMQFPRAVLRPYHAPPAQQPHACTVLVEQMPEDVLLDMLSHAYKTIFNKLPKRTRLAIEQGESEENAI